MTRADKIKDALVNLFCYIVLAIAFVTVVAVGIGIIIVLIYQPVIMHTSAECAKHGWTNGDTSWDFDKYCTRSIDGDLVIAPLDWVKEHCNELGECQE